VPVCVFVSPSRFLVSARPRISLCLIVRNEAHQLEACLAPVVKLVDEVIVVDTGSTDATREVAAKYATRVVSFAWCDDFSAARNESLRHATGDWIFWLDADDRIDAENLAHLERLFQNLDPRSVYLMDTVCTSQDVAEGERVISHVRLFPRDARLRWQGRVHEQVRPCPSTLGYELVLAPVRILHTGYADRALLTRKLHRDIRLLRMDYAVDPHESSTLLHLGLAYARLGQLDQAEKYFQDVLRHTTEPADYLRRVYGTLTEMALQRGRFVQALRLTDSGLAVFPDDEYLRYLRAEVLYELNRYQEAQVLLEQLIAQPDQRQYRGGVPADLATRLAPRCLGEVLRIQRRHAEAVELLRRLVQSHPDDTLGWHSLGRVYIDLGDGVGLAGVRAHLARCRQGELFSDLLLAAWEMKHHNMAEAAEVLDRVIARAPLMPLPRLMRVICLEELRAPATALASAYRDLLRLQPFHTQAAQRLQALEAALEVPARFAAGLAGTGTQAEPAVQTIQSPARHETAQSPWSFTVVAGL
jgi:glycosyltransferase involved in cell wall biosynthesis